MSAKFCHFNYNCKSKRKYETKKRCKFCHLELKYVNPSWKIMKVWNIWISFLQKKINSRWLMLIRWDYTRYSRNFRYHHESIFIFLDIFYVNFIIFQIDRHHLEGCVTIIDQFVNFLSLFSTMFLDFIRV